MTQVYLVVATDDGNINTRITSLKLCRGIESLTASPENWLFPLRMQQSEWNFPSVGFSDCS